MTLFRVIAPIFKPPFFVALAFLSMLAVSWRRWTSLIVDHGRETDLPLRLTNGEGLYRDIHYTYTPFSPYFNALLYRIFGVHMDTIAFSGIICSIILTILCYRIFRRMMPAFETALAVCLVIVLCIFKPTGNLIMPYSFGALHGMVFSIASVLFMMRFAENRRKVDLIIAGFLIGLAGIAKQEFAFASAIAITAYLIFLHRTDIVSLLRDLAFAAIPAMLVAVPVIGTLFVLMDAEMLINDCHLFYTNIPQSLVFYNQFRSGLNYPLWSIFQMVGAAAISTAVVMAIIFFSDRTGKLRRLASIGFIAAATFTAIVIVFSVSQWDGSPVRALPFILIGAIFIAWRRRSPESSVDDARSTAFLFITASYALAMIIRVILRVPSGGFSGSFFLPVGLCLIFYALLWELPRYIGKWTGDESSYLRARTITRVLCCLIIVSTMISFGIRFRTKFLYPISAPRGNILVEKGTGSVIAETLKFIEANTAPDEVISVIPEGNDLAFLTGRRINFRHQVLLPDFLSPQDEIEAINALKNGNVRYVFIPNRAMSEFGHVAFGRDFYQTLGGWIAENYRVVKIFGIPDGQNVEIGDTRFFIKVYERKEQ